MLRLLHHPDRPKIIRKILVEQVHVGESEVSFYTPSRSPRIADDKPLVSVIVADGKDGMASFELFVRFRHRSMSRFCDSRAHEARIDRKPKDERITGGKTSLHLIRDLRNALVEDRFVHHSIVVARCGGFVFKIGDFVRPESFGTVSLRADALDPVAYLRAAVGVDCSFHRALVVIDEQPRRHKVFYFFFHLVELNRGGDGVRRAASELSLVVDRRAFWT